MQISNAASSPTLTQTAVSGNAASDPASESANSAAPTTPVTSATSSPSQDSAVTISPEGAAISAQETDSQQSVSPLKSLAYGTLGLERPDQSQENRNPFYTAGRWIAAGLTIGGIISLLV
jgi:hypothetical protein